MIDERRFSALAALYVQAHLPAQWSDQGTFFRPGQTRSAAISGAKATERSSFGLAPVIEGYAFSRNWVSYFVRKAIPAARSADHRVAEKNVACEIVTFFECGGERPRGPGDFVKIVLRLARPGCASPCISRLIETARERSKDSVQVAVKLCAKKETTRAERCPNSIWKAETRDRMEAATERAQTATALHAPAQFRPLAQIGLASPPCLKCDDVPGVAAVTIASSLRAQASSAGRFSAAKSWRW